MQPGTSGGGENGQHRQGPSRDDIRRARASGEKYNPVGFGRGWTHNFLQLKPWHPSNVRNQARLYQAEQDHLQREKAKAKAMEELRQEQELLQTLAFLEPAEAERQRQQQSVSFMYMKPPGMDAARARDDQAQGAQEQHHGDGDGDAQHHQGQHHQGQVAAVVPSKGEQGKCVGGGRAPPPTRGQPPPTGAVTTVLRGIAAVEQCTLRQRATGARSPIRGGLPATAENQQFVMPDEALEAALEAAQGAHRAAVEQRVMRKLMKKQQREQEAQQLEEAKRFLAAAGLHVGDDVFGDASLSRQKKKKRKKKKKRHKEGSTRRQRDTSSEDDTH